jgi:hypothetical protein
VQILSARNVFARVPASPKFSAEPSVRAQGTDSLFTGQTQLAAAPTEPTCVEKLSRLFPNALPVRIPIEVEAFSAGSLQLLEHTVIEFGTAREVLFASSLPIEFEDRVRVVNADGSLNASATVVAVRYHTGSKAVAARFLSRVENWIIQP